MVKKVEVIKRYTTVYNIKDNTGDCDMYVSKLEYAPKAIRDLMKEAKEFYGHEYKLSDFQISEVTRLEVKWPV